MDATRRVLFRVLALVLAVGVLAFVVSRAWTQQEAARAEPPAASSPSAEASNGRRYSVIGPATKNDPHTFQRAIESLSSDPPPSPAPAEKR